MPIEFDDLEIEVSRCLCGELEVRILGSTFNRPREPFELPYDLDELTARLEELDLLLAETRSLVLEQVCGESDVDPGSPRRSSDVEEDGRGDGDDRDDARENRVQLGSSRLGTTRGFVREDYRDFRETEALSWYRKA